MVSEYYKIRSVKIKRGSGGVNTRILLPHTRVDSIVSHHAHKGSKTCHATPAHQHKVAQVQNQDTTVARTQPGCYRMRVCVWVE